MENNRICERIAGIFGFDVARVEFVSSTSDMEQVLIEVNGVMYECFVKTGAIRTVKQGFCLVDRVGA